MKDAKTNSMIADGPIKCFFVRTFINYDAGSDYSLPKKGLSYEVAEILYVKNANDINWWQARRFNPIKVNCDSSDEGIVPSAERLKRKYSNKENSVNFDEKTIVIEPNGSKTTDKINLSITRGSGSIDLKRKRQQGYPQGNNTKSEIKDQLTDFYEVVDLIKYPYHRPVIVIGPGRSSLYDHLIAQYSNVFASPVNHTTRPKREKEVEGIDYHFIESREEFEKDKEAGLFLETVEYNGNYYGTSLLAVKNVMASRRHCIIDGTISVIKSLESRGIFPIAILICPDTYLVAKDLMEEGANEKQIKTTMQYVSLLNSTDRHSFNAKLRCASMDELIKQTCTSIMNFQKWGVWIRSENQSQLHN